MPLIFWVRWLANFKDMESARQRAFAPLVHALHGTLQDALALVGEIELGDDDRRVLFRHVLSSVVTDSSTRFISILI
jgi:hypothetical protein